MKKLILLILLVPSILFAGPLQQAHKAVIGAGSIDGCLSWSVDQSQTDTNSNITSYAVGQGFQVSEDGTIATISLKLYGVNEQEEIIYVRVGTSPNLSSTWLTDGSVTHTWDGAGADEVEIELDTKVAVTSSTQYYVVVHFGTAYIERQSSTNPYLSGITNCQYYYNATATSWDVSANSVSDRDIWFKVSLCD